MSIARGFADSGSRADHFQRHGSEFGASSEDEYERMAREYLNAEASISVLDYIRRGNGDIIRYNRVSQAFAVMRKDGIIRTFFKPDPAWHGFRGNLEYFQVECDK